MKRLLLIIFMLAALAGCNPSDINDFIEVSPSNELTAEAPESEIILTVSSSGEWTVGDTPKWMEASPGQGGSGDEITVAIAENPSEEERTGSFVITCGKASVEVTITQYGIFVTPYVDLGIDNSGTTIRFDETTGTITASYEGMTPPIVRDGNVVVLPADYSFDIRVIESVSASGNTLTMESSQGNMADLFKDISFTLTTSDNTDTRSHDGSRIITPSAVGFFDEDGEYHEYGTKADEFEDGDKLWSFHKDFNDETIAEGRAGRLYWEKCSFDAGLAAEFKFNFGSKKIDEVRSVGDINLFSYILNGSLDMDFLLHYSYEYEYTEKDTRIIRQNVIRPIVFRFMVGTVPVFIQVHTHLGKHTEFSAKGEIDATAGIMLGTDVNLGIIWTKEGGARSVAKAKPYMNLHHPTFEAQASAHAKVSYYPHIDIMLYNFIGPWLETRPYLRQEVGAGLRASTDGENLAGWKSDTYSGMDFRLGLDLTFSKWDFTAWKSDLMNPFEEQLLFEAPSRITAISLKDSLGGQVVDSLRAHNRDTLEVQNGDSLTVEYLVESYSPIINRHFPCPLALVNFKTNCGELSQEHAVTDASGMASVSCVLSDVYNNPDSLFLTALILDKEGKAIDTDTLNMVPSRWVDLGLPSGILWAAYNVGATSPEEYGNYYAWAETSTKNNYTYDNYLYRSHDELDYKVINNISGTKYDAANKEWGDGARIPTLSELTTLKTKCSWKINSYNGIKGVTCTGPNGNSIFIPFSGIMEGSIAYDRGSLGTIWGDSLEDIEDPDDAYYLWMEICSEHGLDIDIDASWEREYGMPIRPVKDPESENTK